MFGNIFGYSHAQPNQYSHAQQHAQQHASHGGHGRKAKSPVKALPAPTVTNASNPYAMMPFTGQAGGYPQYAQQQQQQQQAPTVVGGGYPTSLLAAQGAMSGGAGMNELNQVASNLWIGSCRSLTPQVLQACGIRHVVNTAKELKKSGYVDWAALKRAGVMVMHVPWEDNFTQQIFPSKALNDAITWIDQVVGSGGNVLVNCAMGRSRSTSLAIAYLIIRRGMSYDGALAQVQSKRPICQPNQFFEEQLRNVERSMRMKNQGQQQQQPQQKHHHQAANQYAQANQYQQAQAYQQQQQAAYQQGYASPTHAPTFVGQQYAGGYGGYTNAYPQTARGVQQQGWGWGGQGIGAMW